MQREVLTLASAGRFGSVTQCDHGCIHLQLGQVSITLTEPQYMRLVALVADSAANFEFFEDHSPRVSGIRVPKRMTSRRSDRWARADDWVTTAIWVAGLLFAASAFGWP